MKSAKLVDVLQRLRERSLLPRFVIDEVRAIVQTASNLLHDCTNACFADSQGHRTQSLASPARFTRHACCAAQQAAFLLMRSSAPMQARSHPAFCLSLTPQAHCVSTWGHDFRPDYKSLGGVLASSFAGVPVTALTATATGAVKADVIKTLRMKEPRLFQVSF